MPHSALRRHNGFACGCLVSGAAWHRLGAQRHWAPPILPSLALLEREGTASCPERSHWRPSCPELKHGQRVCPRGGGECSPAILGRGLEPRVTWDPGGVPMGVDGATEFQGAQWCPVPYVVSVTGRLNPSLLTPPCSDEGPSGLWTGCCPPGELPRKSGKEGRGLSSMLVLPLQGCARGHRPRPNPTGLASGLAETTASRNPYGNEHSRVRRKTY